jgi:phosphoribosylformylglycinamidine synthase PurS subunit
MKFTAEINIMPLKALLDPQGKAVTNSMHKIGFNEVSNVRVGKHITLEIEADSEERAMERVNEACNKILTNPIIEGYEYELKEADIIQ